MERTQIWSTTGLAILAGTLVNCGWTEEFQIVNGYHGQVTNFFCGPASVEMMLDTPDVLTTNPSVAALLALGDPVAQTAIYKAIHPLNTSPLFGPGTDPVGFARGLNGFDSFPNGIHNYAGYSFAPSIAGGDLASRTLAYALKTYNIPASVSVNRGGHWIDVNGVSTSAPIALNGNYQIKGFFIHDPWTGYAVGQLRAGNPQSTLGMGINSYLRYGYDVVPKGGTMITLPNGKDVNVRLGGWFNYFTPTPGFATARSLGGPIRD